MPLPKTATRWPLPALLALLLTTVPACTSAPLKPTLQDRTPRAGCAERVAGLPLPRPPESDIPAMLPKGGGADWRAEYVRLHAAASAAVLDWMDAYTGAARAYASEVELRANTADCLDAHRKPKRWWPW